MLIFRFRVTFEDVEDVERIIDVSAKNTFMDFHHAIQKSINFDNQKDVTFVKVNNIWRGDQQISNIEKPGVKPADTSEIGKFINDPHQRFLYIYDADSKWILRLEVMKLIKDDGKSKYPLVIRESGVPPKQYIHPADIVKDASAKLYKEADDLIASLSAGIKFDKDAKNAEEPNDDDLEDIDALLEVELDDDLDLDEDDQEDDDSDEDMDTYDPEDTKDLNEMDGLWGEQ